MKICKRWLACLLIMALLACVPTAVSAADAGAQVFAADVQHNFTPDEETVGNGLAFRFTLNVQGAEIDEAYFYVGGSAAITLNGVAYKVAAMGAMVTNDVTAAKDADQLVRENARDNRTLVDVVGERLCDVTDTTCSFAVRIINLPEKALTGAIACRPYCVLESADGTQQTVYGAVDVSTFRLEQHKKAVDNLVLPAVGSDIDVTKKKNRIRVSSASAAYGLDSEFNETLTVSLTFRNHTSNWITEETDYVEYTCYDANGTVVQKATTIYIGCIDTKKHPSKTFTFDVPATTAEVRITKSKIVYWTEWS